jgi:CelD/BcsL family acetyltransferase involved in cellulose biosynthesis
MAQGKQRGHRAIHRDYIAAQAGSRTVDVACLTVGETQVAVIYTIRNGKKILAYQQAQIKNTPPNMSVMHVINAFMIKESIERGDEEFDFLGGEDSYKSDFATHTRPIATLRAARPTAREFVRQRLVEVKHGIVAAFEASKALRRPSSVSAAEGQVAYEQSDV